MRAWRRRRVEGSLAALMSRAPWSRSSPGNRERQHAGGTGGDREVVVESSSSNASAASATPASVVPVTTHTGASSVSAGGSQQPDFVRRRTNRMTVGVEQVHGGAAG